MLTCEGCSLGLSSDATAADGVRPYYVQATERDETERVNYCPECAAMAAGKYEGAPWCGEPAHSISPAFNVRFRVYLNGSFSTLTLRPGQKLTHRAGGATDEGFSATETSWYLDPWDGRLLRTRDYFWRDCDGPGSRSIDDAQDGWSDVATAAPWWKETRFTQRDVFAEAAGY